MAPLSCGKAVSTRIRGCLRASWLLFCLAFAQFPAAGKEFSAYLDTSTICLDEVSVGKGVVLAFSFEGIVKAEMASLQVPKLPSIPNLEIQSSGCSSCSQDGGATYHITYSFHVTPREKGEYEIPALTAKVGGLIMTSSPVVLRVVGGAGLSDQALFMHLALNNNDHEIRYRAIEKLTNQTMLFELANLCKTSPIGSEEWWQPLTKLTDPTLLAKLWRETKEEERRQAAGGQLAVQICNTKLKSLFTETNRATLEDLAGGYSSHVGDVARIRLLLLDPIVVEQLGSTFLFAEGQIKCQVYVARRGSGSFAVTGESFRVIVRGGRLKSAIHLEWTTKWPWEWPGPEFRPATIMVADVKERLMAEVPKLK